MSDEPLPAITPETLGVTPRYVLLHNAISRSAHNLSATAKKVTALAMALLPADLSTLSASFTFAEFCKAIGYTKSGESFRLFKTAIDECVDTKIAIETTSPQTGKKTWENFTWFDYSRLDEESGIATLSFSPKLAAVMLEFRRLYSKINLQDMGALQSKYALRIFELAKSYESLAGQEGNQAQSFYFERTVLEFRHMLGVPEDAYQETKRFRQFVIEHPVKEINAARIGLEITPEGIKQGRKIAKYRLNCKKIPREIPAKRRCKKKMVDTDQWKLPELSPQTADDRLEKEKRHLKELYPQEFAELYEAGMAKAPIWAPDGIKQRSAEGFTLETLKKRHGIVK
jgi:plasmid replication initiation protein